MRAHTLLLAAMLAIVLAAPAAGAFPGRNGLIAVSAEIPGSSTATIWVGQVDGSGMRALPSPCPPGPLPLAESCYAAAPAWSPDGRRLAFTLLHRSQPQLWIVNADGTGLHPVPGAHGYDPAWSPDGQRLVFSVDRWDPSECHWRDLYLVNADGSGLELLIRRGDEPDWSVRGEIVFERMREHWTSGDAAECEPVHSLALLRPGERPRTLVSGSDPSWAPGGRAVTYVGPGGVRRKRVGASGPGRLLVDRPLLIYEPIWSPDGRSVVYRRGTRLKRVAARGGRPLPLGFDAPGFDFSPSWQPR